MKAIILSAGQGSRLLPMTQSVPKCCLMLNGKTLLGRQIESLAANGVDDIVVVTGFNHHIVENVINRIRIPDVSVRTLYNPFYAVADNLGTCWVARDEMSGPFLLLNGDTLFESSTLAKFLSSDRIFPITLAVDRKGDYDADDMKISANGEQLNRVGKKLDMDIVNGESIGMMILNRSGATAFVKKVERLMSTPEGLTRWYLSAIDEMAVAGLVGVSSIQGHDWCEVDDLADFTHAEKAVRNWPNPAIDRVLNISNRSEGFRRKVA